MPKRSIPSPKFSFYLLITGKAISNSSATNKTTLTFKCPKHQPSLWLIRWHNTVFFLLYQQQYKAHLTMNRQVSWRLAFCVTIPSYHTHFNIKTIYTITPTQRNPNKNSMTTIHRAIPFPKKPTAMPKKAFTRTPF